MKSIKLYYVHDPMCSWCYGFKKSLETVVQNLPANVEFIKLLGGLAPDSEVPMPEEVREYIKKNWERIEALIPEVRFNYDFWQKCIPMRSTYPACRAVIAARQQGALYENKMINAIQFAYYREARNPSNIETLIAIADEIGLSGTDFERSIVSEETNKTLFSEMHKAQSINATSYPSMVIEVDKGLGQIPIDYNNAKTMIEIINAVSKSKVV